MDQSNLDITVEDMKKITEQFEKDKIYLKYKDCDVLCPCLHDTENYPQSILFCMIGNKLYKVKNKKFNQRYIEKLRKWHKRDGCKNMTMKKNEIKLVPIKEIELDKIVDREMIISYCRLDYVNIAIPPMEGTEEIQIVCSRYCIIPIHDKIIKDSPEIPITKITG